MEKVIKNYKITITVGTIISVLVFAVYTTKSVTDILNAQQNKLNEFDIKSKVVDERSRENVNELKRIDKECQENEIKYTEIKTRLTGIESLLLDMKQRLE